MVEVRSANRSVRNCVQGSGIVMVAARHKQDIARAQPVRLLASRQFSTDSRTPVHGARSGNVFHLDDGNRPTGNWFYGPAKRVADAEFHDGYKTLLICVNHGDANNTCISARN